MGLDTGVMKVTTRLYNEEFLDAQANLTGFESQDVKSAKKDSVNFKEMDASDLEDQRLNKLRVMRD